MDSYALLLAATLNAGTVLAIAALTGNIGDDLWLWRWQLGPWQLHPLVLMFALSGTLMVSKTLRIPKP